MSSGRDRDRTPPSPLRSVKVRAAAAPGGSFHSLTRDEIGDVLLLTGFQVA